jgi:hypothetical protein
MPRLTITQLEKMEKKLLLANEDLAEVFWELEGKEIEEFILKGYLRIIESAHGSMLEIIAQRLEKHRG